MANLDLWEKVRAAPSTAIKPINGGRLRGMSDINPVWRQKMLTELFGPCGIGWKYTITKQWLEHGGGDEVAAFVNIDLFFKHEGAWSEAVPGTGGSSFVTKESKGPYTSDECFKMALTDAISVSCKALGFGADVYWDKDSTKYNKPPQPAPEKPKLQETEKPKPPAQPVDWPKFWMNCKKLGFSQDEVHKFAEAESIAHYTREQAGELFKRLEAVRQEEARSA